MLQRILHRNQDLIKRYCSHQFNQQLYNGNLPRDCFEWFLHQDARYLFVFKNVMRRISERLQSENKDLAGMFQRFHSETVKAEQDLNSSFLKTPSCSDFFRRKHPELAPVIADYTKHLTTTVATGTITEAIVSCYPCFFLYAEVGKQYSGKHTANAYSSWTALYSSKEFLNSVDLITKALTELTHSLTCPILEERLSSIFIHSTTFEIQFCEAALARAKQTTTTPMPIIDQQGSTYTAP